MTAYINKLADKDGNQQLPITHERAVRDSEGTTLETKLQNLEGAMDKAYVAQSDNGMGRITLKKNMVSGVNTLTQSMMQATNTIYVIRYDFTLGEDITVPANCVLEFDGGSLSNGTLNGNILIEAPEKKVFNNIIFGSNCTFVNDYKACWSCESGETDVTNVLNNILEVCSRSRVILFLQVGMYNISSTLKLRDGNKIIGISDCSQYTDKASKIVYNGPAYDESYGNDADYDVFSYYNYMTPGIASDVRLENFMIDGRLRARYAINFSHISHSSFRCLFLKNLKWGYLYANSSLGGGSFDTYAMCNRFEKIHGWSPLKNNDTEFNTKYGIRLQSQVNACTFADFTMQYVETGVALEDNIMPDGETYNSSLDYSSNQNLFASIDIETCKYGYYLNSEGNSFVNCRAEGPLNDGIDHYGIYVPALNNPHCRYNVFVGFVLFGYHLSLTNLEFPNSKFSLLGGITPSKNGLSDSNAVYNSIVNTLQCLALTFKSTKAGVGGDSMQEMYLLSESIRLGNKKAKLDFNSNDTRILCQLIDASNNFTSLFSVSAAANKTLQLGRPLGLKKFAAVSDIPEDYSNATLCCVGDDVYLTKTGAAHLRKRVLYGPSVRRSGTTAQRPTTLNSGDAGYCYIDTDLSSKPIWWNGSAWVDAAGTPV